jgi:hypothetical protein
MREVLAASRLANPPLRPSHRQARATFENSGQCRGGLPARRPPTGPRRERGLFASIQIALSRLACSMGQRLVNMRSL